MGLIRTIAVCVAGNGCSSNVRLVQFCWVVSPPIALEAARMLVKRLDDKLTIHYRMCCDD